MCTGTSWSILSSGTALRGRPSHPPVPRAQALGNEPHRLTHSAFGQVFLEPEVAVKEDDRRRAALGSELNACDHNCIHSRLGRRLVVWGGG